MNFPKINDSPPPIDIPPLANTDLPPLPSGMSDKCIKAIDVLRSLSVDDLAPVMCLASVDMGRRYQMIQDRLASHSILQELAQKVYHKHREDTTRIPELEKKLSETEESLKSALLELDHMKEKEASYERLQADMDMVKKNIANMSEWLKTSELDKEKALLDLKARYTKQMEQEIQEAFNLGYTRAVEKYNIQLSEAEEGDEEEEEIVADPTSVSPKSRK